MLMAGKVSQAAVLAAAAYRDEETFRRITGVTQSKLVVDTHERNTHVCNTITAIPCIALTTRSKPGCMLALYDHEDKNPHESTAHSSPAHANPAVIPDNVLAEDGVL